MSYFRWISNFFYKFRKKLDWEKFVFFRPPIVLCRTFLDRRATAPIWLAVGGYSTHSSPPHSSIRISALSAPVRPPQKHTRPARPRAATCWTSVGRRSPRPRVDTATNRLPYVRPSFARRRDVIRTSTFPSNNCRPCGATRRSYV